MEKYLVAFIDVETGDVMKAYDSNDIQVIGKPAPEFTGKVLDVIPARCTSIGTLYSEQSPRCRYVTINGIPRFVCI